MSAFPVQPITATPLLAPTIATPPVALPPAPAATSFADMLTKGVDAVNTRQMDADKLARAFALDDSIPVHQVTYALEQARLSLELMVQVRSRLIEGYQQLMQMQI